LKPNVAESTTLWEKRVWNTGLAWYCDKDSKAMPIRPSAGNPGLSKPAEYWDAAPSAWPVAYVEPREDFVGKEKKADSSTYLQAGNDNSIIILLAGNT
jgi:hypothetical protein